MQPASTLPVQKTRTRTRTVMAVITTCCYMQATLTEGHFLCLGSCEIIIVPSGPRNSRPGSYHIVPVFLYVPGREFSLSPSLSHTDTHTHTLSLSHTHTHTHTHSLSHTQTHTHTVCMSVCLSVCLSVSLSLSLSHTLTYTHTNTLSLSLSLPNVIKGGSKFSFLLCVNTFICTEAAERSHKSCISGEHRRR